MPDNAFFILLTTSGCQPHNCSCGPGRDEPSILHVAVPGVTLYPFFFFIFNGFLVVNWFCRTGYCQQPAIVVLFWDLRDSGGVRMVGTSTYELEYAICVLVQLLPPAGFCHTNKYPVPVCGKFTDFLCSVNYLGKLADACAPPVVWLLSAFRLCGLRKPVVCLLSNLSAPIISSISGGSRSPFGFGQDTSLSAFHLQVARDGARLVSGGAGFPPLYIKLR